jgi:hypothetical protein
VPHSTSDRGHTPAPFSELVLPDLALGAPFWRWLGLKNLVAEQKHWVAIAPGIEAFETRLAIEQWKLNLRVAVYRKRVHHDTAKNFQLDLFSPDNGTFEYSAMTAHKPLGLKALWHFMAGRSAQEKTFGELKGEFALDVVPTNHYKANTACKAAGLTGKIPHGFRRTAVIWETQ